MSRSSEMLKLESLLVQGRSLAPRLEAARAALLTTSALDERLMTAPSDSEAALLDVLLFRYMRLQDLIGGRLFPTLLTAGGEMPVEVAYMDKLHALERLGIIDSAEGWMELRALRNRMAHDYPDPEIRLEILRSAVNTVPVMLAAFAAIERYASAQLGL